ncbi:hypothetical protein ACQP3J_33775, partial [Escherichia coli]
MNRTLLLEAFQIRRQAERSSTHAAQDWLCLGFGFNENYTGMGLIQRKAAKESQHSSPRVWFSEREGA